MADAEGNNDANTSGTAMLDTTQDSSRMTTTHPKKWKKSLVQCIFALFGIGTLFPWNSFITAAPYFKDYKFANVSDDVDYKNKFTVYVGYANYIPYIIALFMALYIPKKHSQMATLTSAVVMGVSFLITVILAVVDSSQWPGTFFVITMFTIFVFSVSSAVFQSGILAMAGRLQDDLQGPSIQSYFVGQAAGGTVVAIASMLSLKAAQKKLGNFSDI
ncbi:equilibrative nucleoside transporter 3-like [Diadema antillarum]|uniref:equilibrative nucleoside transporter 3-like n=1 Tax=Diadema antillarum TaxID=105358 RepID=UPI003A83BD3C